MTEISRLIQEFKTHATSRWPNAPKIIAVRHIEDSNVAIVSIFGTYSYWSCVEMTPEDFWQNTQTMVETMNYFDAIDKLYYERRILKSDFAKELEQSGCPHVDIILYLSTWLSVRNLYGDWKCLSFHNFHGITVMCMFTSNPFNGCKLLYDYLCQYEEQHKTQSRDVFRCLPLPIANEILEYY